MPSPSSPPTMLKPRPLEPLCRETFRGSLVGGREGQLSGLGGQKQLGLDPKMVGVNQPPQRVSSTPHIHSRVELDPTFWVKGAFGWSDDAQRGENWGGSAPVLGAPPPPSFSWLNQQQPSHVLLSRIFLYPPPLRMPISSGGVCSSRAARPPSQDGIKPRTALLTHSDPDVHNKPCRAPPPESTNGGSTIPSPSSTQAGRLRWGGLPPAGHGGGDVDCDHGGCVSEAGAGQPAFYLHCPALPSPPGNRGCQTLEMIQMQALPRKLPLALTLPSLWAPARQGEGGSACTASSAEDRLLDRAKSRGPW